MDNRPIGIFDSGVGGLKIMSAIKNALPGESVIYVFDRKHAPYGGRSNAYITRRALTVGKMLVNSGVKMVVIACNTATAVAVEKLRAVLPVPVVGVEPPVKLSVKNTPDGGKTLALVTPATARQDRFISLVRAVGEDRVVVAPLRELATLVEQNYCDLHSIYDKLSRMLSPYKGVVDSVALGCTHYYHVKDMIEDILCVSCYTAQEGTASRVKQLLSRDGAYSARVTGTVKYVYV